MSMLENLFSSKVLFEILVFIFENKTKKLSTSEIIKGAGRNQANVLRSLDKLVEWQFLIKEKRDNQNFYILNKKGYYYSALEKLFELKSSKEKKYTLLNEESSPSFLSLHFFMLGYTNDAIIKAGILNQIPSLVSHFKNNYVWFYFDKENLKKCTDESFDKLINNSLVVKNIIFKRMVEQGELAKKLFKNVEQRGYKLKKEEAIKIIDEFIEIIGIQISFNMPAVFDLMGYPYSNYLKNYLSKKIKGSNYKLHYITEKLLKPEYLTGAQLMMKDIFEFTIHSKLDRKIDVLSGIADIHTDWKWLNFGYRGPEMSIEYFRQIFKEIKNDTLNTLKKKLKEINSYEQNVRKEKREIYKKISIDKKHQNFIETLSALSYLKVYRKDTAFMILYCTYKILEKYNKSIKKNNLFYLTLEEAKSLIKGELKIKVNELTERERECVYISKEKILLVGKEASEFINDNVEKEETQDGGMEQIRLLEGTTASLGETGNWVYGEAKIINTPDDMEYMNEGDVLISVGTTPDLLPAMQKASAIVTNQGGITCHAAIVARELKKPCLIGTKYATKVFKNGDKVIVCPRHGYIKFQ